jgi:hypothetical protein
MASQAGPREARFGHIDIEFFDAFGVEVLSGRRFHAGDLAAGAASVIVNRSFVRQFLDGGNAVGRRLRHAEGYRAGGRLRTPKGLTPGRWYEVVGVVSDFPNAMEPGMTQAKVYHPMPSGQVYPVSLALQLQGTAPASFAARLRDIARVIDPSLRLDRLLPLDQALREPQLSMRMAAAAIALVTLSVVLLSAAGIYALISFTVAQRRRDIAIRSALGASPRRILRSIFSRVASQLAGGLAVGLAAAALLERLTNGELMRGRGTVLLPVVSALMLVVGVLATLGPARHGLHIAPADILKEQ